MTVVAAPGPHLRVEIGEESRRRVDVLPAHDDASHGQSNSLLPVALRKSALYFQKMVPP